MKRNHWNIIILILCTAGVIGFYFYDVFCLGTPYMERLPKVGSILLGLLLVFVRSRERTVQKRFRVYEEGYGQIIKDAFSDKPSLKRKLLTGIHNYNNEKYEKAIKCFLKLQRKSLEKKDVVPTLFFTAASYARIGCVDKSIELYEKLLKLDPENAVANNNLARQYYRKGNFEAMLEHYEKAVRSDPNYEIAYYNRAFYYFENHMLDEAISDARRALNIKYDYKDAVSLLAIVYDLKEDEENARKYYNMSLDLKYNAAELDRAIEFYRNRFEAVNAE